MGWNFRTPTPLDPDTDPDLPQADSSQGHDIPTGVSPTTAKLQDWIAWLRAFGVFYLDPTGSPGLIANDITVGGDLTVTGDLGVAGATNMGSTLAVGGAVSAPRMALTGTQPAASADPGANTLHGTNLPKAFAYLTTDGSGGHTIQDGFCVASAALFGSSIRFTFARAMANANYTVSVSADGPGACFGSVASKNALYVDVSVFNANSPSSALNPTSNTLRVDVAVHGRH